MGFFDAVLGRSKQSKPNLDALFALPTAAITLQASLDYTFGGVAAVCFKPADGGQMAQTTADVVSLLDADNGPKVEQSKDEYGYVWLTCRGPELSDIVTDIHAVNSSLQDNGFGPQLLCSEFVFKAADGKPPMALVYLYKRGSFYPFCQTGKNRRDNGQELTVRQALGPDLPVESDLSRWFPIWDAPGLGGFGPSERRNISSKFS